MNLPSVVEILPFVEKGGHMQQTVDVASTPGTVLMVHASQEQIDEDIRRIREAEASGELYVIEDSTPTAHVEAAAREDVEGLPEAAVVVDPYSSGRFLLY